MSSQGSQSYKDFLSNITKYGVTIKSRYEMTFSGIENVHFFVTTVSTPGVKFETQEIKFWGRSVEIPMYTQYEHDFSMTVINDNNGTLYKAFKAFMMNKEQQYQAVTHETLRVKVIGDNSHKGYTIKLENVRIKSIGSLSFGQGDNDVSTFEVSCSCTHWTF